MQTTIDGAGRIVVPKSFRDELGLRKGQQIEITLRGGLIEIAPAPTPMRLVRHRDGLVAEPDTTLPPLTTELVRDTLERVRR